jgi:hypothetical protein
VSVEFEPVRLGRRGRRIDPVTLGALAVVIALGFAVVKPWAGATSRPGLAADEARSPVATSDPAAPTTTPDGALPRVIAARSDTSLHWDAIEGIVRRHDAWGVRAIVTQVLADSPLDARQRFLERWYPLPEGGEAAGPTLVDSNDRAILAVGITFPPTHTLLDVRIWRRTGGGLEWVDIEPLDPVPSGGAFLYRRPGTYPATPRTWASGEYRIDVLVDGGIRRFDIAIPDRFSNVPGGSERPSLRDQGPLAAPPTEALLTDLPVGLFATVDGVALPLEGSEGEPLDEAAAWLDVDPGTGREPRSFVARAYLPRATGLAAALPARSVVMAASVTRLAPEPLPVEPQRVDVGADGRTASAIALFRAPGGSGWVPGVYRVSVRWGDVEGLHDASWHVELRPGPVRETPRLLAAARGWARYAGATGVILGTAEPLEGGPRSATIRLLRLRGGTDPAAANVYPASTGVGCGGTIIDGHPGILGLGYPADRYETEVRAMILRPFLRRGDQVLMRAAFGVPGLILVAPARTPTLPNGTWRFTVGTGATAQDYVVCLGMATFDD